MNRSLFLLCLMVSSVSHADEKSPSSIVNAKKAKPSDPGPIGESASEAKMETAIFAGGCFWCMQPPFDRLKSEGIISVKVGYSGGSKVNPTYHEVSDGGTGHREAVEVIFNPKKVSYEKLLSIFWENVDPLDGDGQFCDKGEQYTSAIFYSGDSQKVAAEKSLKEITEKLKKQGEVKTKLIAASPFYGGEDYHQSYYQKNPVRYKFYRYNCGRDKRLKAVWGREPNH